MTKFESWFIRRVLRREVRQDFDHHRKIAALYGLIRKACEEEFTEDNAPTLSANLSEWFETTQVWPFGEPHDIAINVMHKDCHKAADAFWTYWNANGVTHKHGYYESTWGAVNAALRVAGVHPHKW